METQQTFYQNLFSELSNEKNQDLSKLNEIIIIPAYSVFSVYIPNRDRFAQLISQQKYNYWVYQFTSILKMLYGGFCLSQVKGGYTTDNNIDIEEETLRISAYSFSNIMTLKEMNALKLLMYLFLKDTNQEAIIYEYGLTPNLLRLKNK